MAKEWARFGSGQFMQQATSPQQHMSMAGHPNGAQLPHPPLPHLPPSPFSPLLQYADRDRQHSPSFLIHGKPMPLACSPSPTPSPNQLLVDRLQSPSSPFLRHHGSPQFLTPNSPSEPKFGSSSSNDLRRLSVPTPPGGLPYHMSPGGRGSVSPVQPTPLWRSASNPSVYAEGEKARSMVSSQDVQDRLRYLAQQRAWQKDQGRQPEASLRMGFGAPPPPLPSPERNMSMPSVNGQFGGLGRQAVASLPGSPSPTTNKPPGNLGYKGDSRLVLPVSGNDLSIPQYGSQQRVLPPPSSVDQACPQQRPTSSQLPTQKEQPTHPTHSHNLVKNNFINGYDSHNMEPARLKMSETMTTSAASPVMVPSRPPPAYPHNGVAFAKSSAPTLQSRRPSNAESPKKNPDMLSREREQQILADIQKRFCLPNDQWSPNVSNSHGSKVASNNQGQLKVTSSDRSEPALCPDKPKVKKKRKKKVEAPVLPPVTPVTPVKEKVGDNLLTQTSADISEKYPTYAKIMASFIEASNKSGLNSPYSCLKKNGESVEKVDDGVVTEVKKKKKKKLKALKEAAASGQAALSNTSSQVTSDNTQNQANLKERTGVENALPSIAGFAFLQKDSTHCGGSELHSYPNIPAPVPEDSENCGYNVQTYNSVLSKLQDQLKRLPETCGNSLPNSRGIESESNGFIKKEPSGCQTVSPLSLSVDLKSGVSPHHSYRNHVLQGSSTQSGQSSIGAIHMGSNNIDQKDYGGGILHQSANHLTQCSSTPVKVRHPQDQVERLPSVSNHHQASPGDKSVMCCDTCHKVGKQDSYLCSSHKVLLPGCDSVTSDPSSVPRDSAVPVKSEQNGGVCDSIKVDPLESSGIQGRSLSPQTGLLANNHFPVKQSAAFEFKDVEFKTDEQDRIDRLKSNAKIEIPECNCLGPDYQYNESTEGPFYTHLGAASSIVAVRKIMEERFNVMGSAIRIEKVRYTGKEGKSPQGCPIAKWILRRSGPEEKVMCIVKHRPRHVCPSAYIIVAIVAWEGLPAPMADDMYNYVISTVTKNGFETDRRCGTNEAKTCACQGWDLEQRGASFSFGCSWSMYFNGCKFARSREAKKFKLKDTSQEGDLEAHFQNLATHVGPLYKQSAPESYQNQVAFENEGNECRLGNEPGRPFSGVTTCMDFCAHAHKDLHNMNNGCTVFQYYHYQVNISAVDPLRILHVHDQWRIYDRSRACFLEVHLVVTLTKHRGFEKPDDEQLHVLPLYVLDSTDEFGSEEGLYQKVRTGSLEVLNNYPMEARIRAYPLTPKKRGKGKKDSPSKKEQQKSEVAQHPQQSPKDTDASQPDKQLQYQMMQHLQYQRYQQLREKMAGKMGEQNAMHSALQNNSGNAGSQLPNQLSSSETQQMGTGIPQQGHPLYEAFCSYFDKFGRFPPQHLQQSKQQASPSLMPQQQQQQQNGPGFGGWSEGQPPRGGSIPPGGGAIPPGGGSLPPGGGAIPPGGGAIPPAGRPPHSGFHNNAYPGMNKNLMGQIPQRPNGMFSPPSTPGMDKAAAFPHVPQQSPKDGFRPEFGFGAGQDGPSPSKKPCLPNHQLFNNNNATPHQSTPLNCSSDSPLHLLSEAVSIRSNTMAGPMSMTSPGGQGAWPWANVKQEFNAVPPPGMTTPEAGKPDTLPRPTQPMRHEMNFSFGGDSRPDCADGCMRDTNFLSADMEYNEDSFLDPQIGGVAVALTHGSVYFEVAKRELHATTALRRPNRKNPTRISMVFYQHKNMNLRHHGWYENERKAELMRVKRLERMKEGAADAMDTPSKPGPKKKKKKSEEVDFASTSAAKYKYMLEAPVDQTSTMTTDSIIVRWIDSQPMVTGPYQRWVSH